MVIKQACRWLSRDKFLGLGDWRRCRSLYGVFQPDGPKCTINEQVRQLTNLVVAGLPEAVVLVCIIRPTAVVIS